MLTDQKLKPTELRSAFLLSEGRAERVQRFRDERLAKVIAGETPGRMGDGLKVILHVVPLAGSATNQDVSLQAAGNDMELWPLFVGGYDDRYNLDGLLKYYTIRESGALISYLQIFRNGALEAGYVYGDCVARGINGGELETEIIRSLGRYLHAESRLGVEPPFVVMLSLVGVGGCWVGNPGGYYARRHNIDQDDLLLPDVLIEDFRVEVDVVLRPLFDVLWQASGYARCPNYGEDGRHISARR
jgi:hypothetical protein